MCMQRRKDLTATEGHVVLLEYFEEFPLMLSHPGWCCIIALSLLVCVLWVTCMTASKACYSKQETPLKLSTCMHLADLSRAYRPAHDKFLCMYLPHQITWKAVIDYY